MLDGLHVPETRGDLMSYILAVFSCPGTDNTTLLVALLRGCHSSLEGFCFSPNIVRRLIAVRELFSDMQPIKPATDEALGCWP